MRANKPWRQLNLARDRGRVNDESWRIRSDGTQYWANNVIAALPENETRRRAYYMVTQDLSQRRHAETLADTAQRMHEFIAMLAHELRNPLAPIRNAVALMARRNVQDPLVEAMRQTIDRQSLRLTRIVDELLDVNRVARGQFTIEKQVIDLRDVLARAVETSRPLDRRARPPAASRIADKPVDCFGDPMRLHAGGGEHPQQRRQVHARWRRHLAVAGKLRHARRAARARQRPWHRARRASIACSICSCRSNPNSGSALGGLGVGLALVRRIVELHGGSVHARSEGLGKGSEFIVRLPIAVRPRRSHAAAPTPRTWRRMSSCRCAFWSSTTTSTRPTACRC